MGDQWAPPVPARPPGWTPHPQGQPEQQYRPQEQYQGSPQHYPQQYQPPQYPPPGFAQQPYQQQGFPQQQHPSSHGQYQQSFPPQQYASQPHFQPPPGPPPSHAQYGHPQHPPQARQFWQPVAGTTWQMVLHDPVKLDHTIAQADVWNIDVFDTPASSVAELHRRGRKVIGYFSGGTYEDWRPDAHKFRKEDIGKKLDEWEGEKWVQTSSSAIRHIMIERIELALSKGFDGIDVDNVDGYDHKTGLGLSKDSAVDFIKFLSHEAHSRGLACGLKNASDIIPRVIDDVQWIVQEQCVQYGDEEEYLPFIRKNKPVFHVEYPKGEDTESSKCNNEKVVTGKQLRECEKAKEMGFSTIIKNIKLDQWVQVV